MSYEFKNFSELDFEQIKTSLKQYLSTQEAFVGFDFEGTAINALVNLLAYNTQYNAFYLNMHASERFLSTAQRRENVVALAKNLGYIPHSSSGATGSITVEITTSPTFPQSEFVVPKHTLFKASSDDETFTLYTSESQSLENTLANQSKKTFRGSLKVFEGKKFTQNFTFTSSENGVVLPNKNVQVDKLVVTVTTGSLTEEWQPSSSISRTLSTSKIYFTEEVVGQKTRVYFGDDIVGKKPAVGSTITVTYFTSKGSNANGASDYSVADSIPGSISCIILNPKDKLSGGVDIESMESIRTNAPLSFETQGRAVTAQDFKNILQKLIPSAHTVSAWGGEDEVGEQRLGYVFLTWVTEEELNALSQGVVVSRTPTEKAYVQEEIRTKYATVTIFPEVKDPQFVFLKLETQVFYDSTSSASIQAIQEAVKSNIKGYYEDNISRFQTTLRYSKISTAIDNSSQYITSNDLSLRVYQEKITAADASNGISIGVPVKSNTLSSSFFTYTMNGVTKQYSYFSDKIVSSATAQTNEVFLWYTEEGTGDDYWKDASGNPIIVGTVNRDTGTLTFTDVVAFDITQAGGISASTPLKMSAEPRYKDIDFGRNLLAVMRDSDIIISVVAD